MPSLEISDNDIEKIGSSLRDVDRPLKDRFRALFTLKNIGNEKCIAEISKGFSDESSLLKHELAYCLGQMGDKRAIPILSDVLEDDKQEVIVRHEAGEALGAIGSSETLPLLQKYSEHPIKEIAETCQLAIAKIEWLRDQAESNTNSCYNSIDPAPPMADDGVDKLTAILLDENENLFERYRAMFALRNKGSEDAVLSLCKGLLCKGALFRHEIAFVLGQMAHPVSTRALQNCLENIKEQSMVRHECAEALGAIATDECFEILKRYQGDDHRVVKESCDVALDMCEYENSTQFQYANGFSN